MSKDTHSFFCYYQNILSEPMPHFLDYSIRNDWPDGREYHKSRTLV
jgi:hypothetical protein